MYSSSSVSPPYRVTPVRSDNTTPGTNATEDYRRVFSKLGRHTQRNWRRLGRSREIYFRTVITRRLDPPYCRTSKSAWKIPRGDVFYLACYAVYGCAAPPSPPRNRSAFERYGDQCAQKAYMHKHMHMHASGSRVLRCFTEAFFLISWRRGCAKFMLRACVDYLMMSSEPRGRRPSLVHPAQTFAEPN